MCYLGAILHGLKWRGLSGRFTTTMSEQSAARKGTTKYIFLGIALAVILVLVALNRGWLGKKETAEGPSAKGSSGQSAPSGGGKGGSGGPGGPGGAPQRAVVRISPVATHRLDNKITATGSLVANEEIELHAEISGLVQQINFKEGQQVKKGQVLFTIRTDELRAQLQKLDYSRKLAATNEERQRRLLEKEAISRQEYDIAQTQLQTLGADIANVQALLEKAVVRAPFDGRVGLRYISQGSYITPQNKVANLISTHPIKLDFTIPARYASLVDQGQKINFTVEGGTDAYQATVYAIEPSIDPNTRTITLRAQCDNSNGKLFPGMFANIQLVLSSKADALMIPNEALEPVQGGYRVYRVKGGKAEQVSVTTGLRTPKAVEIVSGLNAGDTVVSSGIQSVKPGVDLAVRGVVPVEVE